MATAFKLTVNGKAHTIRVDDPDMPLLYALRDNLGLHGPRFGCGLGQRGACTVHVDGKPIRSCQHSVASVADGFVAIDGTGTVTVYSGKVDLGTGLYTALMQIALGRRGTYRCHRAVDDSECCL